ncbi:hypothetical protein ABZY06_22100 [Streptomyces sp. NPDC006540]|uniref:hypothetical protein n=1 Tax=Streptomyces sp. NPDC006540 TaxID=3155353 RepID=UPI0033B94CBF
MQIAGLDLYLDHPVMALGSGEWNPTTLALQDRPAAGCETHVVVRVQAQVTLVKVRVFVEDITSVGTTQDGFTTVFDGSLLLADGRLVVGDVIGQSRFTTNLVGRPGRHRVTVAVDNPLGPARAVDITLGQIPL